MGDQFPTGPFGEIVLRAIHVNPRDSVSPIGFTLTSTHHRHIPEFDVERARQSGASRPPPDAPCRAITKCYRAAHRRAITPVTGV